MVIDGVMAEVVQRHNLSEGLKMRLGIDTGIAIARLSSMSSDRTPEARAELARWESNLGYTSMTAADIVLLRDSLLEEVGTLRDKKITGRE